MRTYPVDEQTTWHDGKRYLWLLGLVVPALPFLAMGLHVWTGLSVFLWLGPFVLFVVVPLTDAFAGLDPTNRRTR